jgi:hypothetical protein
MDDQEDEALIREILPVLEVDHQYARLVEAELRARAQIRRCGRTAGKRLGYKIRTFASDPDRRGDQRRALWVLVISSNLDDPGTEPRAQRTPDHPDPHRSTRLSPHSG